MCVPECRDRLLYQVFLHKYGTVCALESSSHFVVNHPMKIYYLLNNTITDSSGQYV